MNDTKLAERASAAGPAFADMANAIRALAMDAVEKAKSGHPGMPMGMADVATVLFTRFMNLNPADTAWPDRDRFVLSAGHGSMLQYALHYLVGYPDMPIEQLEKFRQLGSRHRRPSRIWPCAGHRDHHRPARPGRRHRRRHGARRAHDERPLRQRPRRSLHLCDRRRRLPDGGHFPRGHRPRRPSQARQADPVLGRQPHFDRRLDQSLDLHRPDRPFRCRRLEHHPRQRS